MIRARDNDREQRHTKLSFPTGYRQMQKEKIIYAADMSAGFSGAITRIGVSPCYLLSGKIEYYVYADLKVPIDRVPDTPMLVKGVYCTNGGGGNMAFYVDLLVAGKGQDLTMAAGRYWMMCVGSPANIQNVTPTATIQATDLDGVMPSVDFQLQIGRVGNHDLDTSIANMYLFKLIFEYTAYV